VATIHHTTMTPTKLELLAEWLPRQAWWRGGDRPAQLRPAGGFRLDDPQGEVGIEFLFVTDSGDGVTYHVPLAYRGAPWDGAEDALVGTGEHGVLGRRWIYDGVHDPAVVAALDAFVHGRAAAQHQKLSDKPDPSVTVAGVPSGDVVVDVVRVLGEEPAGSAGVQAGWTLLDGTVQRGPVVLVR
jgi:Maltokinase N-terminal cap domain